MISLIVNAGADFSRYNQKNFYYDGKFLGTHKLGSLAFGEKINAINIFFLPESLSQHIVEKAQNELVPDYHKSSYEYIKLLVFLKLIDIDLESDIDELYLNIMYGLNVYPDVLKEACRSFVVFKSLKTYPRKSLEFKLLFGDPIIGNTATNINLYTTDISTMVLFDTFVSIKDLEFLEKDVYDMVKNAMLILKAIKYNIPLFIYTKGYHDKNTIQNTINHLTKYFYNTYKKSIPDSKTTNLIYAIMYLLAIYHNLSNTLESLGIAKKEWINLQDLETFIKIYNIYKRDFGQNEIILRKDIRVIQNKEQQNNIENILRLKELDGQKVISNPSKRNWKAHSGLEGNITFAKYENNKLCLSYDKNFIGWIEKCLLED
ncbi:TM1812 family CRISPR-associated protein [Hydrogenobaculum acidophilum]